MQFKSATQSPILNWHAAKVASALLVLLSPSLAHAANLQWAGRTWKVTSGGMAGVAQGSPNNVSVDSSGYLHLKITNTAGTWTAAEVFTTDLLGFGTYQWQVDGPIDRFDQNVVLGMFPYGPAAGIGQDGSNEIDIEYSFWGHPDGVNGDWTDYPSTGDTIGETSYKFSLNGGTDSTSRFIWNTTSIQDFLMTGFQTIDSTTNLLKTWTYSPATPTTNIPQQAMPVGINLWCFGAPPSDGNDVEVVIRDFQFLAEGTSPSGAGGTGAGGAAGNSAGGASPGGMNAGGAAAAGTGGMTANAGAAGSPAAAGSGGSSGSSAGGANSGTSGASSATNDGGSPTSNGGSPNLGSAGASTSSSAGNNAGPTSNGDSSSDSGGCSLGSTHRPKRSALWLALPLLVLGRRLGRRRLVRANRL